MTFCLSIKTYNKRFGQISFLPLELDPLTYTKDLQRAKFRKSITGHNFWLVCPTGLRSTSLSCIFNALFRDTSLAYLLSRYVCHICHVTCVTCVTYVTCQMSNSENPLRDITFDRRVLQTWGSMFVTSCVSRASHMSRVKCRVRYQPPLPWGVWIYV